MEISHPSPPNISVNISWAQGHSLSSVERVQWLKSGNSTLIKCYFLFHSPHSNFVTWPNNILYIATFFPVSASNLEPSLFEPILTWNNSSVFVILTLTFFKNISYLLYRLSPNVCLTNVSSWLCPGYAFFAGKPQKYVYSFQ